MLAEPRGTAASRKASPYLWGRHLQLLEARAAGPEGFAELHDTLNHLIGDDPDGIFESTTANLHTNGDPDNIRGRVAVLFGGSAVLAATEHTLAGLRLAEQIEFIANLDPAQTAGMLALADLQTIPGQEQ